MLTKSMEEMLKGLTESEISALIGLAYKERQNRDEAKKRNTCTQSTRLFRSIWIMLEN